MDVKEDTREAQEARNPKSDEDSPRASDVVDDIPTTSKEQAKSTNRLVRVFLNLQLADKPNESQEESDVDQAREEEADVEDEISESSSNFYSSLIMTGIFIALCALEYPANVYYEMQNILTSAYSQG